MISPLVLTRRAAPWIAIVLCTLAVYAQCWKFQFVILDDNLHIVRNPGLQRLSGADLLRFWREPMHREYVPFTYMWWSALTRLSGRAESGSPTYQPDPGVFHLGNVLLHALSGAALFTLLRRLVDHEGAACLGALVFLLHPLQAGSVAWASEARGLLSGLFVLLAADQFFRFLDAPRARSAVHYSAALACFLLAVLAKATAVCAPLLIVIIAVGRRGNRTRQVLRYLAPWVAPAAFAILVAKFAQPDAAITSHVSLILRPVVALQCIAHYLHSLAWPVRLAPDYGILPHALVEQSGALATWMPAVGALTGLAWFHRASRLGALVFLAALTPVLGIVPFFGQNFSAVADRYAYLALIGPALTCSIILSTTASRTVWSGVVALLLCWGAGSAWQASFWRSPETLFRRLVAVNPQSHVGQTNLGLTLVQQSKMADGLEHARLALKVKPNYVPAMNVAGWALVCLNQPVEASGILSQAVGLSPQEPDLRVDLACALLDSRRYPEAQEQALAALSMDPVNLRANVVLGHIALQNGQLENARAYMRQAESLDRNAPATRYLSEQLQRSTTAGSGRAGP